MFTDEEREALQKAMEQDKDLNSAVDKMTRILTEVSGILGLIESVDPPMQDTPDNISIGHALNAARAARRLLQEMQEFIY